MGLPVEALPGEGDAAIVTPVATVKIHAPSGFRRTSQ